MDVLSDVLTAVQLTGAIFFDLEAFPPWVSATPNAKTFKHLAMPSADHVIAFHVVMAGECWAELPGISAPTRLVAGDLVVVPMGDEHVLSSAPGMRGEASLDNYRRPVDRPLPVPFILNQGKGAGRTHLVCGFFGCDLKPFNPLLEALPRVFHASVSAASHDWLLSLVRAAVVEHEHGAAGRETMLAKIAELMFVEVLRKYIAALPPDTHGWCAGLCDPQVSAVLGAIHARPAEPWTVEALAKHAGMSRSSFSDRFTHVVGIPPMQYLARWRLQRAAGLLSKSGMSAGRAAAEVGYESEAAFNRAFKKLTGMPPGQWRKRGRAHDP